MPKILVADDNSNVQKTMALALADLGVEVISVNNGEAAVRKLADVSPDLVLADIFMPVRNGYEVCEYIKKDSRFAQVPVILLVGAFDPLDEREAQRVGADGILKKPFVPPDPLIAMVKSLLDRSMSDRLVSVSATKPPIAVQVKAGGASTPEPRMSPPPMPEEPSPEESPASAARVTFGEGERPMAFGQLLDAPAQSSSGSVFVEPVDDEQVLTSSRDANLGEPAFWRNDPPEAEVEPEAEQSSDGKDDLQLHTWGQEKDDYSPQREDAARTRPVQALESPEPLELVRDGEELASPSQIDSGALVLDPAEQSPLTVESGKAPELAANPLEWLATAPVHPLSAASESSLGWGDQDSPEIELEPDPFPAPLKAEPEPFPISYAHQDAHLDTHPGTHDDEPEPTFGAPFLGSQSKPVTPASALAGLKADPAPDPTPKASKSFELPKPSEFAVEPDMRNAVEPPAKSAPPTPSAPALAQDPEDTARSVPVQKWAEMTDSLEERASEMVKRHLVPVSAPPAQAPAAAQPSSQAAPASRLQSTEPSGLPKPGIFASSPAATNTAAPTHTDDSLNAVEPGTSAAPDPALVEAVVQRVLDKMRPQVVDIITKEFLRPVVQALVHREIEKQ